MGDGVEVLAVRVFGDPVPQGRPRARAFQDRSGTTRVSVFDPATSRDWKRTVAAQVIPVKPPAPVEGPLVLIAEFYLRRPASLPKREWAHVKRPDGSNLLKSVEDAMRGIVYRDDSQLVDIIVRKRYDQAPGVGIRIERAVRPRVQEEIHCPASARSRRREHQA